MGERSASTTSCPKSAELEAAYEFVAGLATDQALQHEDVEQYSEYELEEQARLRHSLKVLATYLGITDFATRFPYPT